MTRLAIVGAGGHGKVAAEIAELNGYTEIHFYDDDLNKTYPWSIIGRTEELFFKVKEYDAIFVAIGSNSVRKKLMQKLTKKGGTLATLIHPSAVVSSTVKFGKGVLVVAGAIINPDTKVGEGSIINTGAKIDHDCKIGQYVHVAPGVTMSGSVIIGDNCWIGVGTTVIQQVSIVPNVYLGAGSLVLKDIEQQGVYYGSPATFKKAFG